jgi:hypothetical protein
MKIKFSRHAQRRTRLYGISKSTINAIFSSMDLHQGIQEIVKDVVGFMYPIKIIFVVENKNLTIITCYHLKKRREK